MVHISYKLLCFYSIFCENYLDLDLLIFERINSSNPCFVLEERRTNFKSKFEDYHKNKKMI
jgi:hypothetical protein